MDSITYFTEGDSQGMELNCKKTCLSFGLRQRLMTQQSTTKQHYLIQIL